MFVRTKCLASNNHPELDLEKWQKTVDLIAQLFNCACGAIVQLRDNEFYTVRSSQNRDNFLKSGDAWPYEMNSFCRHVIEKGSALYVADPANDPQWSQIPFVKEGPIRSYFGVPIYWPDNSVFGTICAIDTKPTEYNDTLYRLLEQLRELITADLKLIDAYENVKNLALTDELTGLYNRRGLSAMVQKTIQNHNCAINSIAVAYFDSDNLKEINNQLGHDCGDIAIQALAVEIKKLTRSTDILARVGGDEFVLVLNNIKEPVLRKKCQLIESNYRANLAKRKEFKAYTNGFSVSYGCLCVDTNDGIELSDLCIQADKLMYANKMSKRNG